MLLCADLFSSPTDHKLCFIDATTLNFRDPRLCSQRMGLEGVEVMEKMASFTEPLQLLPTLALSLSAEMSKLGLDSNAGCAAFDLGLCANNSLLLDDNATGQSLLMQVGIFVTRNLPICAIG